MNKICSDENLTEGHTTESVNSDCKHFTDGDTPSTSNLKHHEDHSRESGGMKLEY